MPDDIKVLAGVGDDTVAPPVATDLVGGKHYQKIKNGFGADGVWNEIDDIDGVRIPVGGAQLGAINETAPGSDIANAGLNGRLQRIAQRLTSLIGQIPATLGQKTAANSLAVVLASDQPLVPTSTLRRETPIAMNVAVGATLSQAISTAGYGNFGLIVPSNFDGTSIMFQVSDAFTGTYVPLYDITNTRVTLPATAGRAYDLPGEVMVWTFIKAECAVPQVTDTTVLTLVLRS